MRLVFATSARPLDITMCVCVCVCVGMCVFTLVCSRCNRLLLSILNSNWPLFTHGLFGGKDLWRQASYVCSPPYTPLNVAIHPTCITSITVCVRVSILLRRARTLACTKHHTHTHTYIHTHALRHTHTHSHAHTHTHTHTHAYTHTHTHIHTYIHSHTHTHTHTYTYTHIHTYTLTYMDYI